ncbi:MAG: chromosomal replication initiator protein DnaA [Gracilibacteraceae bacterium]|jgi:chromosomal replication initiator protein|nr:chromosomal replication initiator protein DnaA [Gracilibacteraceae bacterium]
MKTPEDLWYNILEVIRQEISANSFDAWFSSSKPVSFEDNSLTVSVPDEFIKTWLEGHFHKKITSAAQNLAGAPVNITFVEEGPAAANSSLSFLNARYTFQNFVIGDGNRFAHAAALAVAEFPAKSYNPLFIYGGSGLGKTHLMHAIAHKISQTMSHFKTIYITGEQFTNEMIDSIRHEKQAAFRDTYRKIDMLLVDDIQFLANREATQMEFFYTFNALHEANKQIIISSDMQPRDIPRLEERLRSRFEGGLTTDISPPDYETRMAILRTKIQQDDSAIPDDVLNFIASSIYSNVRELEGALNKLTAYCSFTGEKPTVELTRSILRDLMPQNRPVTAESIMNAVAKRYSLTPDDLRQNKRSQFIALPRQIAMYLCRDLTELSLPQIGEAFGGRDHSTVIHAVNKIREMKEKDAALEKVLRDLITTIKSA